MARKLTDARLGSKVRRDRSLDSTKSADSRLLDDQQRLAEFQLSLFQSVLPDLPRIKGYHVIWLTTTNPQDSIPSRIRLGYEPIKVSEVPGFENWSLKTGEYAGLIGVNEMVAFKLPLHLYQMYMKEAHHDAPLQEEQKLDAALELMQEEMARRAGRSRKYIKVEKEGGTEEIILDRPAPKFAKATGER